MKHRARSLTPEEQALQYVADGKDPAYLEERFVDPIVGKPYIIYC
jgi:hypothetical protein